MCIIHSIFFQISNDCLLFYRNQDVLVLSVFEKIVYYGPYQFVTDDNGLECNLLLLFTNFA